MRVVLADDSVLFREGAARILRESGFEVVGQAGTVPELMQLIDEHKPDVAIVDIRMPPTHTDEGLVAAERIRASHSHVGVLVLSQYIETSRATRLLAGNPGGSGYLLKDRVGDIADFAAAVRRVGSGGSAIDPVVISRLLGRSRSNSLLDDLSPREREVLALMAEGCTNGAISQHMRLSAKTVETHVRNIFGKLELPITTADHRRVLAVLTYLQS